jgi:hypothetical protein
VSLISAANNGYNSRLFTSEIELEGKISLFVNSTIPKGVPNKIIKNFLNEDFFHLPPVSTTPVEHALSCRDLREFSKKFEMALVVYSGA